MGNPQNGDHRPGTPEAVCDKINCPGCPPDKCHALLILVKLAASQIPAPEGRNKCEKWEKEFMLYVANHRWLLSNPCVKAHFTTWFMWFTPWAGHAAYKITLCDGSNWYVDFGITSIGGCGIVGGVGSAVPPWLYKEGGKPWPWWTMISFPLLVPWYLRSRGWQL
jgi:hypothetical protein